MRKTCAVLIIAVSVFLMCGCAAIPKGILADSKRDFKFAVLGDSQFNHPDVFENMINEVELLKPAFVIQIGDLIHGYQYDEDDLRAEWERFKGQIAPLSMPYYPVAGNHDVCTLPMEKVYGEVWGNDRYYYSFDYGNSHFIVLDTFYKLEYDKIGADQMEFLRRDLEAHRKADNIFVFLHSPLDLMIDSGWHEIHHLLKKYPVKIVFNGHSHIYNFHEEDGIRYICLNSSGNTGRLYFDLGWGHEFVVTSVQGEDVTVAVVKAGSVYSQDLATSETRARAAPYLSSSRVIEIPDPSAAPVELAIPITVRNRVDQERKYDIEWSVPDERWEVWPMKQQFTLDAKSTLDIIAHVQVPKGDFSPAQYPVATVSTPYETHKGKLIKLKHKYSFAVLPEATARRASGAIKMDGQLHEPDWKEPECITDFKVDADGAISPDLTVARILYDQEYIYVGIWGLEPNPGGMRDGASGPIPFVFGDDSYQIYFDTNRDRRTYFRFMSNSKGVKLSSGPRGLNKYHFDVANYIGNNFWSAEFRFPLNELGVEEINPGDLWGLNIRRSRYQSSAPHSDWSKMQYHPYEPQRFGKLKFE